MVEQRAEAMGKAGSDTSEGGAHIVRLRECGSVGANQVGTKAWNLGQLLARGFPVPDGFVLTTSAFNRFLAANELGQGCSPEAVLAAEIPGDVENALIHAAGALGDISLAVRSSGVAEDLAGASFAGQYETVLGVRGREALTSAVRRCWASAFSERVAEYQATHGPRGRVGMAVLVQRLVPADAAGVAFTANPVTGERSEALVSAVQGLGERLVSGQATPDEWTVKGQEATRRSGGQGAIRAAQARAVAELARRVERHFGVPQDIEWAIARGELFLLQARPMTALADRVEWEAPLPGGWLRNFRLGEWIGDPVTPLFESWLLTRLEERLFANFRKIVKGPVPRPLHVVVNGWYFATGNFVPSKPSAMLRMMLRYVLPSLILRPRRTLMMVSPMKARGVVNAFVREWRESILPRYRAIVEAGQARVDSSGPSELLRLVDEVADTAGDYFFSVVAVAGNAWKTELALATFYHETLYPQIGGTHQRLLQGLGATSPVPPPHSTIGLDWFFPTIGEGIPAPQGTPAVAARWARVVAERREAERKAREALAGQPKLLKRFERRLETAQRFALIREEHVSSFTLGWPLLRRAVLRLGDRLRGRGVLADDEDVFFLSHDELVAALHEPTKDDFAGTTTQRRLTWERQRRLAPPVVLGQMSPFLGRLLDKALKTLGGASTKDGHAVSGLAASPGRATGPARVIRRAEEFDRLQPGDVLVSPATTPAWTPLFSRAVAIVTDIGSLAAHASLVAREYGIPAVVGTGDATTRLRDGQTITVDGSLGVVDVQP